jgi:hypothetical protein
MQRQISADDSSNGDLQPNFSEAYDPVSLVLSSTMGRLREHLSGRLAGAAS